MLQYMYTGETLIQQERVSNFLEVAKELDIGDIMKTLLNIAPEDDDEEEEDEEVDGDTLAEDVSVMQEIESEVVKLEKVVKEPAKRKESSGPLPWKDKDSTVTLPWQVMETAKAASNLHAVTTNTLTSSVSPAMTLPLPPRSQQDSRPGPRSALFDTIMSTTCPDCGATFTSKPGMKLHQKAQHSGITFPCGQCEYRAKQKEQIKRHTKSVHDVHQCTYCDFKAIGQRNVLEHTKAKHLPKKKVVRGDRGILKKRIRTVDGVLYGGSL